VHRQDRSERACDDKDDGHRNGILAKPLSAVGLKNEHVALVEPSQNTRLGKLGHAGIQLGKLRVKYGQHPDSKKNILRTWNK
jgi:hypothetical protein